MDKPVIKQDPLYQLLRNEDINLNGFIEAVALSEAFQTRLFNLAPLRAATAATMRIYNRDGTDGEVCGNGLRCVGALLCERDGATRSTIEIDGGRADHGCHAR